MLQVFLRRIVPLFLDRKSQMLDDLLNLGKLFLCHCLSIAEVKSGALTVLIGTCLLYVGS